MNLPDRSMEAVGVFIAVFGCGYVTYWLTLWAARAGGMSQLVSGRMGLAMAFIAIVTVILITGKSNE